MVLAAAYVANAVMRIDLYFNDVVQEIKSDPKAVRWGDRVVLIPSPFAENAKREIVMLKLKQTGFVRTPAEKVWARYQSEIDRGRELYTREANNLACNIKVYVFLEFNDNNELSFAEGTLHEHGCL